MKNALLLIVLVFGVKFSLTQYVMFSHGESSGVVNFFDKVTIREEPNDTSKVLLTLPQGSKVENFYQSKSSSKKVIQFKTFDELKNHFSLSKIEHNTLLIKGSRGMALERVVALC